ncbi:MAG: uracil-DNA glycosylase, partial [Candidatus Moranbacteria bacterium]|nr:uracil-DNA glycosylase [Candidatus Moranbacteria bacterium]
SKQEQLSKLNARMTKCTKCTLRSTCSRVVFGSGDPEAEIMFIGEAPGKKEDETGQPFVGAAGKFLNEMLAEIKLKREAVYIANVCKCRPPENRDPSPEEIAACWPWLLEQIRIIQPKLIITLGRHSMERFLTGQKISQIHGTLAIKTVPGIGKQNFYILYHPAAALYNGSMRETLIRDFRKIPKVLAKIH